MLLFQLGSVMKIISVTKVTLPVLLLPVALSTSAWAASGEQTMIVSAAPQAVSELDSPAAVSVVQGDEDRKSVV